MTESKLSLLSNGKDLGEINVKTGIIQGHSLSPLLFPLNMVPLLLIRETNMIR